MQLAIPDTLTTGGSIVKLKNMTHPDASSWRELNVSMALIQVNASLTATVTWSRSKAVFSILVV